MCLSQSHCFIFRILREDNGDIWVAMYFHSSRVNLEVLQYSEENGLHYLIAMGEYKKHESVSGIQFILIQFILSLLFTELQHLSRFLILKNFTVNLSLTEEILDFICILFSTCW